MKHNISLSGFSYRLRPVYKSDAQFIIDTRLEDANRNKYIHLIDADVSKQEKWIENYLARENDYYFVVENALTGEPEGLIGLYDIKDEKAEWGRWVIKKGSLAAVESVDLICQVAFNKLGLKEIYSRTIENNQAVVSFHNSAKEHFRRVLENFFELNGEVYNAVEHYIDISYYKTVLMFELQRKAQIVFSRNLRQLIGDFKFHHLGLACSNLDTETYNLKMLGYRQKDADFEDKAQGIKGRFLVAEKQPEIELLCNLEDSNTLDFWLKNKVKIYHMAYEVDDFDYALDMLRRRRCVIVKQPEKSTYFGKRICFLVLSNMLMIELVEM